MPAIALGTGLIHGAGLGSATARVDQGDSGAFALLNTGHEIGGPISTTLLNVSVASAASGRVVGNGGAGTATVGESGQE